MQNYQTDSAATENKTTTTTKQATSVKTKKAVRKNSANTVSDGYTKISDNIDNQVRAGLSGKYRLKSLSYIDGYIGNSVSINTDVTIDLNGQKLKLYSGVHFDIKKNGHLTIEDSQASKISVTEKGTNNQIGNLSSLTTSTQGDSDNRSVPVTLDYYVTQATPKNTTTEDQTIEYEADLSKAGRIYSETSSTGGQDSTFMIEKGGTLDFNSGVAYNTGPHVVATKGTTDLSNKATLNLSGGYLIGNRSSNVIYNNAGNVLNISGGVITNGKAQNGAGIYNNGLNNGTSNGGTINLTGGIITGNEVEYDTIHPENEQDKNRYSGGGIYMQSGILNISGDAYITNNKKTEGSSSANHFSVHGGGGVAAHNDSQVNMSGGYITGNYSKEAGGGLYLGYYSQTGLTKLTLTGGVIASNIAQTGEGGGLRVGGSGRATIRAISRSHPIYITNNTTNTGLNEGTNQAGDWGGGGVFVQENGQLNIMNVIITANTADGFGAGVSACPTGGTKITTDQGAAIYKNSARGDHYSRGSATKNEDAVAYDFYQKERRTDYQDYFLAHDGNSNDSNKITDAMLGGGSEEYYGTFNNNGSYEQPYNSRGQSAKFIGLSAKPSPEDINKALAVASTYISGNHSHNHGGGIMTDGMLNIGESTEVYPALHLNAYKAFLLKSASADEKSSKSLSMKNNQFKFALYEHTGASAEKPQWDGTKFTAGDGENTLVTEFGNDDAASGHFAKLETSIPNDLFEQAGDYTFYLVEEDNEYKYITYDHTIYSIHFTVTSSITTASNVETTKYSIKGDSVHISKITKDNEESISDYRYDQDESKNTSQLTLYSDQKAAFTNTQQAYDFAITKIEKDKPLRKLQGADFTLYKIADNYREVQSPNVTAIETKTTDQKGSAVFSMLKGGEHYYLKETKAPDQHKIAGPWIISIDLDGKAKFYEADCTESDNFDHPNPGDYSTITKNSSGKLWKGDGTSLTKAKNVFSTTISDEAIQYTMPNTGGKGTYVYYQVGILLITLVNIFWIVKRRVA